MAESVKSILADLRNRLQNLYDDRLAKVLLFGSHGRGEATSDSDIDVMVVLRGKVVPSEEIARTIDDVAALSLANDVVISCVFMAEERFMKEQSPLLLNVRREGVIL